MKKKYNKKKIKKTIKKFKKREVNIKDLNIFLDIDNTLALFSQKGGDELACKLAQEDGYYENLPIFHCVEDTLMYLTRLGAKIWILSAYPLRPNNENIEGAKDEKNKWLDKYLPFIPIERRLIIPVGTNKASVIDSVCDRKTAIFIDDYGQNILHAYEAGIVGIKKTYSGKKRPCPQIQDFYDIFKVLNKLNVKIEEEK